MPGEHPVDVAEAATSRRLSLTRIEPEGSKAGTRAIAAECPVAIEYNGLGYAVMMATPADLDDLGIGFTLTERIAASRDDIVDIEAILVERGMLLRITLAPGSFAPMAERVRHRVSDSGCGLCGVENLEQALRPLPVLEARPPARSDAIFRALAAIGEHQPLNRLTGAVHGAAFCDARGEIVMLREDVGRHNALDKLIGGLASGGLPVDHGFFLLTSRCSYELVEKTVIAGCPLLVTVSAPTTLAVDRAKSAGLTLVTLARADAMLAMNDPWSCFS